MFIWFKWESQKQMDEDTIDHFHSASLTIKGKEKNTNKEGKEWCHKSSNLQFHFFGFCFDSFLLYRELFTQKQVEK